ncbi:hypothetical protein NIES593_18970, partial [Hydrococcus rivularis NIES-593]
SNNYSLSVSFCTVATKTPSINYHRGDRVVYRHVLRGAQTGKFMGVPPTGKWVSGNGFTLLRLSGDKIVEMWYETNLLEVMKQLGAIS